MPSAVPSRAVFRLVIADDHGAVREALAELLGSHPRLRIVAVACDAIEAIVFGLSFRPDAVLLDSSMPYGGGVYAAEYLAGQAPAIKLLVLTAYTDDRTRSELLRAGAAAVWHKGTGDDLAQLIVDALSTGASG